MSSGRTLMMQWALSFSVGLNVVGFVTPYWIYNDFSSPVVSYGLWQICGSDEMVRNGVPLCEAFTNELAAGSQWWLAVRMLETFGTVLIFISCIGEILLSVCLKGQPRLNNVVTCTCFLSGICTLAGFALFLTHVAIETVSFSAYMTSLSGLLALVTSYLRQVNSRSSKSSASSLTSSSYPDKCKNTQSYPNLRFMHLTEVRQKNTSCSSLAQR